MKLLFILILGLLSTSGYTQDDTISKSNKVFKMKMKKTSGIYVEGFVKNMNDSMLYYSVQKTNIGTPVSISDPFISYAAIEQISIKRKGATGRGAIIGGILGFITGFIIGSSDGDTPKDTPGYVFHPMTATEKGLAAGAGIGLGGALIGAIWGAFTAKDFKIQSDKTNFLEFQQSLAKKTKKAPVNY